MRNRQLSQLRKFGALVALSMFALSFASTVRAYASSSSVGVFVDQPTTTTAAPTTTTVAPTTTTTAPATTTTAAPTTTTNAPTTTSTTVAATTTIPVPTTDPLPEIFSDPVPVTPAPTSKGVVAQVRSAARTTKDLVKGVVSGKPVAEVAQAVLPANVATVVVPAVRTASTFVFPIGLAAAVIAFLALQQRIDSSDPKLIAAPLAHDDDFVEFS